MTFDFFGIKVVVKVKTFDSLGIKSQSQSNDFWLFRSQKSESKSWLFHKSQSQKSFRSQKSLKSFWLFNFGVNVKVESHGKIQTGVKVILTVILTFDFRLLTPTLTFLKKVAEHWEQAKEQSFFFFSFSDFCPAD